MKKLVNDIERGPIANSIALHDFGNTKPDLRSFMNYVVGFFERFGIVPTRISNPTSGSTKTITFKNGIKKLELCNYDGIDGIEVTATPPNHGDDFFDAIFLILLDLHGLSPSMVLCFDDQIAPFTPSTMNDLARDLARFFGARYGYCYQRDFKKGPGFYPFGTISGLDYGDPERALITKWMDVYHMSDGCYKTGDLRDIYPMNVLCKVHLDRVVLGQCLEDWILQNSNHGTLTKFDNNLCAWWVEAENISLVREALRQTGIILCI